jgi:DNA repair photolyase
MFAMRWDNLLGEEQRHLPGYRDPAVIRRFDAPEALDMRFYEIHAKSVLNRVPAASRMPFRWTVNPYRGCSHACSYCASGDTPILMGDGTTRPLAHVRAGDAVYGTRRDGNYRRFEITTVQDHWATFKQAYRVTMEDGTELVTSGDHRFLSSRGWKHVTGAEQGRLCRPHLTTQNKLIGTGQFARPPERTLDYEDGYLCGLIRGDGHVGSYSYDRAGGRVDWVHCFRLALADNEALVRARTYLSRAAVDTHEFVFLEASGAHRQMNGIRTGSRRRVERVRELIRWPDSPNEEWCKGFLAGIFDAEGSCSDFAIRISNCDPEILRWVEACLKCFRFDVVAERLGTPNGMTNLRIRGGLSERLRFFHTTDPAITRKRSVEGQAIKTNAKLRVVSIEPLGRAVRLYDITTGTGDFIANGVISHNCFARPTHTYLDFDAGRDFEREIVVKVNAPEVLRAELARPSWKHEHVAMGTNTDPYQWVEAKYRLMPGIWEALRDSGTPCSVLTKSPLLLRDLDVMLDVAKHTEISAALSVPTIDEKAWRATEPHTPSPRARLEAVAELNRAGIPTGVLVAPLMPGINDAPEQVAEIVRIATEAGATHIGGIALHLRSGVREVFFDWLSAHRPDLVDRYEELYKRGAYAPSEERKRLARLLRTSDWRPGEGPSFRRGTTRHRRESERERGPSDPAAPDDRAAPSETTSPAARQLGAQKTLF